jgi:hypothetical protein
MFTTFLIISATPCAPNFFTNYVKKKFEVLKVFVVISLKLSEFCSILQ